MNTYAKLLRYIKGATALMPRNMNKNPRTALNFGEFIEGSMLTIKAAVQDVVISTRKQFLAKNTGLHENEYKIGGYEL